MNTQTILKLLQNSGFNILGVNNTSIVLEDPACVLRSFETFVEYAWIIISIITMFLLFGWGISLIRGAKTDLMINMRNLLLMFGTLSVAVPVINMIYGDDLFSRGCRQITVSLKDLNTMLDARNSKFQEYNPNDLYENLGIYDSGVITSSSTYATAPLMSAGEPVIISESETVATYADTRSARAHEPAGTRDVVYTNPDGTQYRRTGGTRAWRNKNPGNIRYSEFSRRMGAIGNAGGFAVFPDEQTGRRAIESLLRTDSYNKLTVAGAISRYAPPSENNTAAYHRRIGELTGLSINRRVQDLSDAEISRIASAIQTIEGWKPGQTVQM